MPDQESSPLSGVGGVSGLGPGYHHNKYCSLGHYHGNLCRLISRAVMWAHRFARHLSVALQTSLELVWIVYRLLDNYVPSCNSEILLWFSPLPCFNNCAIECARHVRVLWLWWWLYSAVRALVCISWQMGFSAPLVLPVMMSHVSVYQTGHTQLSPHLLLSQSPIPPSSIFIFLPLHVFSLSAGHTDCLSLSTCPCGKRCPTGMSLSLLSNTPSTCVCMCSWQMQLWLHDSFAALWGEARMALTTRCAALIIAPSRCLMPFCPWRQVT